MPKFSVKKPLTIFVAVIAILVLGVVAYLKMTPDLLPNMDFPYVVIVTADPGASPEAVEEQITKPMEKTMATLNDIKSVTSTSQNSASMVMLEFEEGVNLDTIGVDIQQKIAVLQGEWEDTVAAPYVLKINPSMLPVMVAAISSDDMDINELSDFVDETLGDKLSGVTGVASVDIVGAVKQEAHVILSREKLDALSVKLEDAIQKQLDDIAGKLRKAKKQVQDAQEQIADMEREQIGDMIDGVVNTAKKSLSTLTEEYADLGRDLEKLSAAAEEYAHVAAQLEDVDKEIAALEETEDRSPEENVRLAQLVQQKAELTAQKLALETQFAAMGISPEQAEQTLAGMRKAMEKAERSIEDITDGTALDEVGEQTADAVVGALDAMTQIVSGSVQMSTALSQIEQGLSAIEDARKDLGKQTDLSGTLNVSTVAGILTAQNFAMPAGYIDDNEGVKYMVSVGDEITDTDALRELVLIDLGMDDLEPILLGDVAEVVVTDNSDEIYATLNGKDDVIATFTKQSNYATAAVSENVAARFEKLEAEYPGIHFSPLMDQGDYIHLIVSTILSSLLWGALFSVIVLFLFLRDWRPTVITLVSIPVSLVFAVVLMYFSGVTINMISLSGLAVSVGMLVDNSVVVIENIYRLRDRGATVIQAAVSGAQQVLGAIIASTLTTVCVFLPIVFVEGLTKTLFTDLALTMTYSLMASLLVALTLVPAMAQGLLRKEYAPKKGILDKVYPVYRKAVGWSLDHKAVVLAGALALLIASTAGALSRGFAFMPQMDMNMINASVTMPEGTTMEQAVAIADEVVARAMTIDDVETVGASMMGDSASMLGGGGGSYDVTVYITLPEGASGIAVGKEIERLCADMDCEIDSDGINAMMSMMVGGTGISLTVYGDDMEDLQTAAKAIARRMEGVKGTAEVSDGLEDAAPAVHIAVDRLAAMEHGMTVAQVYLQIAQKLTSTVNGPQMKLDDKRMELILESAEGSTVKLEELKDLELTPDNTMAAAMGSMGGAAGADMSAMSALMGESDREEDKTDEDGTFRLGEIATVEKTVSMEKISRDNQRRCIGVSAQIAEGYNVTLVTADVEKALKSVELPDGVSYTFGGENEEIMHAMRQLVLMMLLGVLLVYFIMVAQFQSLKAPFIVMFTIPLAFTGGFLALLISGIEVSVVSMIGFVMLIGIIVNNGIVLVDYINQQRLSGMTRREAIIDAGVTRMRPILMTSLTTILGLIIMALAKNVGTSLMQPVALVCIGGLLYATLMTLFVVPCMYDIFSKKELRKVDESELKILDD